VAPAAPAQLAVYTDSLQNGFVDWPWGTYNLAQTAVVHSGTAAISFEPDNWDGLFLHRDAGFTGTEFEAIELWVRGGGAGGQQVTVAILSGGSDSRRFRVRRSSRFPPTGPAKSSLPPRRASTG